MTHPFQEVLDMKVEYEVKVAEFGVAKFEELFQEFFDKHPCVEAVQWTQWTPYFNDGDPCQFSVNETHILVTRKFALDNPDVVHGYDPDEDDSDTELESSHPEGPRWFEGYSHTESAGSNDLAAAVNDLSDLTTCEDILETVFGDPALVCACRDENGGPITMAISEVDHD